MEDYDDIDVFFIYDFIGSSNGSNPSEEPIFFPNDGSFYKNEEVALK